MSAINNTVLYLQVYRKNDASVEDVEKELSELLKFIHTRSRVNKNIKYIVTSYSANGKYASYIILMCEKGCRELLEREAEIIHSYSVTKFENIYLDREKPKKIDCYMPLPKLGFFREEK